MFQRLNFEIASKGKVVIDDSLKNQYQGIKGLTMWTPEFADMRNIDIELKIDDNEVFSAGFPAEIYSTNSFRNPEDCYLKVDFPKNSKIEGSITNGNDKPVNVSLIFHVNL